MNVIFYKFSGEANLVDKTNMLSNSVTLQCNLKENTSVINPSILLNMSAINRNVTTYNYCYIELFGRYYFVDDVIIEANNIIRFNLSVDVLMSYKTFLFGQKALISRNQYLSSENYSGGFQIDKRMQFSNEFDVKHYNVGELFPPISGDESIWFCMTYFSSTLWYLPEDPYIDPYETISRTVLMHTNSVGGGTSRLLSELFKYIVTDYEGFGSYVCSIYVVPFNPQGLGYDFRRGESLDTLTIGNKTIDLTQFKAGGSNSIGFGEYVFRLNAYTTIPRKTFTKQNIESYFDFPPYKEYKAYLPFIGAVDIPIEAYSYNGNSLRINLDSIIDFTTGVITYKLSYETRNYQFEENTQEVIFYEQSVECLCPIPISSSNAESMNRAKDAYTASFTGQAIGSAVSAIVGVVAGVATGNPALAIMSAGGAVANVVPGLVKMDADLKKLVPSGTSQKASSIYSTFKLSENANPPLDCKDFIILEYTRKPLNDNEDYYRLNGHMCHIIKQLNEVYGYTEIGDMHLEIPSILTEESETMMSLLTGGVIFPDPPT